MKLNFAFSLRYLMKLNPSYGLLPILAVGMILSTPARGQEEKSPMEYETTTIREVKNDSVTSEAEFKTLSKPVIPAVSRETESPPAKSTKTPVKPADKSQKSPEDPLSFNFLYYIIEKFKMSDMIE